MNTNDNHSTIKLNNVTVNLIDDKLHVDVEVVKTTKKKIVNLEVTRDRRYNPITEEEYKLFDSANRHRIDIVFPGETHYWVQYENDIHRHEISKEEFETILNEREEYKYESWCI